MYPIQSTYPPVRPLKKILNLNKRAWNNIAVVCHYLEDREGFDEAVEALNAYDVSAAREWEAAWPRSGASEKR